MIDFNGINFNDNFETELKFFKDVSIKKVLMRFESLYIHYYKINKTCYDTLAP